MQAEFGIDHMVSWYVSRRADVPAEELRAVELPETVVGANGATLRIVRPIPVDDEHYRSYEGVLAYPGAFPARLRVQLDVNPYSSRFGELGLRPVNRMPRVFVSAERYFDGAWSVLDALAAAISGRELTVQTSAGQTSAGQTSAGAAAQVGNAA